MAIKIYKGEGMQGALSKEENSSDVAVDGNGEKKRKRVKYKVIKSKNSIKYSELNACAPSGAVAHRPEQLQRYYA